jgi:hypothetical protein
MVWFTDDVTVRSERAARDPRQAGSVFAAGDLDDAEVGWSYGFPVPTTGRNKNDAAWWPRKSAENAWSPGLSRW